MASNSSSDLSCSVCSSPFSDPRLLPCLHVFCKSCLDPLYSQNEEGTLACPTCYKINTCPSPYQLPRHLRIEREVTQSKLHQQTQENEIICQSCDENKKAEAYCKDCDSPICSDCKKSHELVKVLKKHSVVSLTESQSITSVQRVPCIFHPDEYVKYYCSSCSCLVCGNECLFNHKEHNCNRIVEDNLVKKEKSELQGLLPQAKAAIPPLAQAIDTISDRIEETQINKNRAVEEINSVFNCILKAVEKRRADLIKEVSETALAKSTQLEMQKESIQKLSAGLELASKEGNVAINNCNDVEVLAVKGSIMKALNELLKENKSTNCDPVCGSGLGVAINSSKVLGLISHLGNVSTSFVSLSTSSLVDCPQTIAVCKSSEYSITLQNMDHKGNELTEGGAIVTATLNENTCGQSESYQCVVKDMENGQYEIMLNTTKEGQFTLHVSVDNTILSPMTVNVRDYTTIKNSTFITTQANPAFVYIDPDGLGYVTFTNGSTSVYNNGRVVKTISKSQLGCGSLRGIAVGDNIMFIADEGNHQIIKASLDGKVIARVGSQGSGELEFNYPMGLCLAKDNLLLVADCNNDRVQVLGSDLSFIRSIPCLSYVWGVAVDGTSNLHAAAGDRVEVFNITSGEKITEYGQGVLTCALDVAFLHGSNNPYSFVTNYSSNGSIYVFDWSNNTVVNSITCDTHPLGIVLSHDGCIVVCCYASKAIIIYS